MTTTEEKTWDEMTPEEQAEFSARMERESFQRKYGDYQAIIEELNNGYETGLHLKDLTDLVWSWVEDQRDIVADEKEEELKSEAEKTAAEIASDNSWEEKDEDEDGDAGF